MKHAIGSALLLSCLFTVSAGYAHAQGRQAVKLENPFAAHHRLQPVSSVLTVTKPPTSPRQNTGRKTVPSRPASLRMKVSVRRQSTLSKTHCAAKLILYVYDVILASYAWICKCATAYVT